jgi:hypothetical protein
MNRWSRFIQGNELVAITYLTDAPEETVYPWVTWETALDDYRVQVWKKPMPLTEFLNRLVRHESGLRVRSKRRSNGKTTSIAFNKAERVHLNKALLDEVARRP